MSTCFKIFRNLNKKIALDTIRKNSTLKEVNFEKKVFSGIQPTGGVHLGNYLGAILNWVKIQDDYSNITLSIVDLHSITLPQDPEILKNHILEMTATLLACGIDPNKSTLFLQSTVPQHTQLCWQLSCLTTMARLAHLPQYKEKSATLKDIPLGLFIYPVLQAADILIHKATHVPVGEDQVQQLQLAQHLAKIFNFKYGVTFPTPHAIVADGINSKIRNLRNPEKKMSKSEADSKSRIHLNDTPEIILEKVKKAVTDFTSEVYYDAENRPGVSNLMNIHSMLTGLNIEEICLDAKNKQLDTGKYKLVVGEAVANGLAPIREKINNFLSRPQYLYDVLENGRINATEFAQKTLDEVHSKVGTVLNVENEFAAKEIVKS